MTHEKYISGLPLSIHKRQTTHANGGTAVGDTGGELANVAGL